MSQPSPARRASSSRSHLGVVKTPSARSASGAAPGALLRVNQEGMCLHVEPFGQFDPMPAASGLLGRSPASWQRWSWTTFERAGLDGDRVR